MNADGAENREFLVELAREAGGLAMRHFGCVEAEAKGESIVSEADRAVEELIISRIRKRFPGEHILAEESGASGSGKPQKDASWWAIDPIDGTGPYLKGMPFWSVSIAHLRGARVESAAVFMPALDELFYAREGAGASRNGADLKKKSSSPPDPHSYLFVPCNAVEGLEFEFPGRRLSLAAASVHLCYTAAGSAYGTVVEPVRAYDIAAAALVLDEAGGAVRYISGRPVDYLELADGRSLPEPVAATSKEQVEWLRNQVRWR